jgi:transposase
MALRKSKLSESKQARLLEYFVGGATARCDGSLVEVNKTTAAYYIERLREIIAIPLGSI